MSSPTTLPRWALVRATFSFLLLGLFATLGCEDELERRDLIRERQRLQTQRRELEATLKELQATLEKETAGKTQFTDDEKARLGPLWLRLREVDGNLLAIDERLRELSRI